MTPSPDVDRDALLRRALRLVNFKSPDDYTLDQAIEIAEWRLDVVAALPERYGVGVPVTPDYLRARAEARRSIAVPTDEVAP